jgi:hypothetical protein
LTGHAHVPASQEAGGLAISAASDCRVTTSGSFRSAFTMSTSRSSSQRTARESRRLDIGARGNNRAHRIGRLAGTNQSPRQNAQLPNGRRRRSDCTAGHMDRGYWRSRHESHSPHQRRVHPRISVQHRATTEPYCILNSTRASARRHNRRNSPTKRRPLRAMVRIRFLLLAHCHRALCARH